MSTSWIHPDMAWFVGSLWHCFDETDLLPVEQAYSLNCTPRRRQEYIGCRYFARSLLESLGFESVGIGRGRWGEPIWPEGIVGSISHTGKTCFIAAGKAASFQSVGVDIDTNESLEHEIVEQICTREEIRSLEVANTLEYPVCLSKLLFCAKESIFKCMFPITGEYWEFNQVEIAVKLEDSTFVAKIRPSTARYDDTRLDGLIGRFYIDAGHILCLAYLDTSYTFE